MFSLGVLRDENKQLKEKSTTAFSFIDRLGRADWLEGVREA